MPLIRVLEIAPPTGNFHFGGGEPQTFVEVDWFRDDQEIPGGEDYTMATEKGRANIAEFIKKKSYFKPAKAYLVLHEVHSFTIGYSAP